MRSLTGLAIKKKKEKLERHIVKILKNHQKNDSQRAEPSLSEREEQTIETLRKKAKKIKTWLKENKDKKGVNGTAIQSNITDNDTAKMKTSNGVIQGINGIAMADEKHQVVVAAQAFGSGSEQETLIPMIKETQHNFWEIGKEENIFERTKLSADCGFSSKENATKLEELEIDAYIPDNNFRQRDENFSSDESSWTKKKEISKQKFTAKDFKVDPERICKLFCVTVKNI